MSVDQRVRVDGKFFRLGENKFYLKGLCYGPFAPNAQKEFYASPEQTRRDFAQILQLGANVLRVYELPPRWFLDLAQEHAIKVFIDVPWNKHLCFLDSKKDQAQAREAVRHAVRASASHSAVLAYSVVNEIPAEIVRWSGAPAVADFIDSLIETAKAIDPGCLCTFGNFPPTEFLRPRHIDFVSFNVYLHQRRPLENYLARLQMLAEAKPLVLAEFGLDSQREGEASKCEVLEWHIESAFRSGLAGAVVYSYTDDWFKDGYQITDWSFGITTRERQPKDSFAVVQTGFQAAPHFPLTLYPKVSVVVACYNGARTLRACLDSLGRLRYPYYEVILVDDGSTDATPQIGSLYKDVRYLRQPNKGLSVARNTGVAAATGEIVAFTDADCRADEDWLYYLVSDLLNSSFIGIGGHNFLPEEDSAVAAAVLLSPGGPAHVMLNDRVAEHIPGCNMAFYKWALDEVGGFDPIFHSAGDDVDICWRLQQRGYRIGFSPAGFVWHYRRSTVRAYLKQQRGYGEAEALLVRKHPEYFNSFGGSVWRGRIYTASKFGVTLGRPIIYHGVFGSSFFQTLYAAEPAFALMLCTSLEYHVFVTLPLLVLAAPFPVLLPLGLASLAVSLAVCVAAAFQADVAKPKRHFWSRPLIALLFFLQPIVRGWARYQGRLSFEPTPRAALERLDALQQQDRGERLDCLYYWSETGIDRMDFVGSILLRLDEQGWPNKADAGWSPHDVEIFGNHWSSLRLATVAEDFPAGRKLFRCRLRTVWSLPAIVLFWGVFGFQLLIVGVLAREMPWVWMLLLTMPLLGWYLEHEKRNLQRLIAVFLDEVARQRKMTKMQFDRTAEKFVPVSQEPEA